VEAPKAGHPGGRASPPADAIADVERILAAAGIEVGGVEYSWTTVTAAVITTTSTRSRISWPTLRVLGFDPFTRLVDFLEGQVR
jgi:hypothetical protein